MAEVATVDFWLTPTIERDYKLRGVFPHLRLVEGWKQECFAVTREQAREMLADAMDRRDNRLVDPSSMPKGTPKAYTDVIEKLRAGLDIPKPPIAWGTNRRAFERFWIAMLNPVDLGPAA